MEWRDQGILLQSRTHGETSAIVEIFTAEHGRHAGVVRGGVSRKLTPILQPGNQVACDWRARLDEHIGTFRVEPITSRAATLMQDRASLSALGAICALLSYALPEREPHPKLYDGTMDLLAHLMDGDWQDAYLAWEIMLLEDLGFGLDLSACAATGAQSDLIYVSPRTGRAISRKGAGEWADRLLPMPGVGEVLQGLGTTGYFLENWLAPALGDRPLPEARGRLLSLLAQATRKGTP